MSDAAVSLMNDMPIENTAMLGERVRRLEDAVALLQDTRQLEERITERLSERLARKSGNGMVETGGMVLEPRRQILASTIEVAHAADAVPAAFPTAGPRPRRAWSIWDTYQETRAMVSMFFDPRYRMNRWSRLIPMVLLVAILTSWIWVPGLLFLPGSVATLIDKSVDLVLSYFLYKILSREARRYRETAPDLPPGLRL